MRSGAERKREGLEADVLEAMGVTDVIVGFRNVYQKGQDTESLQQKIDALNNFAENTISAFRNG